MMALLPTQNSAPTGLFNQHTSLSLRDQEGAGGSGDERSVTAKPLCFGLHAALSKKLLVAPLQ